MYQNIIKQTRRKRNTNKHRLHFGKNEHDIYQNIIKKEKKRKEEVLCLNRSIIQTQTHKQHHRNISPTFKKTSAI